MARIGALKPAFHLPQAVWSRLNGQQQPWAPRPAISTRISAKVSMNRKWESHRQPAYWNADVRSWDLFRWLIFQLTRNWLHLLSFSPILPQLLARRDFCGKPSFEISDQARSPSIKFKKYRNRFSFFFFFREIAMQLIMLFNYVYTVLILATLALCQSSASS